MFYESLCVEFLALYLRWVLLELQRRYQITGSELTPSVHGGGVDAICRGECVPY